VSASWSAANSYCKNLWDGQGNLASIDDDRENEWVFNKGGKNSIWIGGNDISTEGNYVWSDGCSMSYKKWAPNQPDNWNNNEDCLHLVKQQGGKWNDILCSVRMRFVCKKYPSCVSVAGTKPAGHISKTGQDFYFGTVKSTWSEANSFCKSLWDGEGNLASIDDDEQNSWVFEQAEKKSVWIGGNDLATEDQFVWSDGCKMSYSNWNTNEPNNYGNNEDCVHFIAAKNGKWNDLDCNSKLGFVCKRAKRNYKCNAGNNYYFSKVSASWSAANSYCKNLWDGQGNLATINDNRENEWIFNQARQKSVWIGGNDIATEGQFVWSDGCSMSYRKWAANQPDNWNSNEDCLHLVAHQNGKWNDIICSASMRFVCQKHSKC